MKREIKYVSVWLTLILLLRLSLFLPHREMEPASLLNASLQLLLCILCIDIAVHSYKEHKHVYLLFALCFAFSILLFGSSFVGPFLFTSSPYSSMFYHLYANKFGMNFVFLLAITFALIDYVATHQRIIVKYVASFLLAMCILLPIYSPFLLHPFQLYYEPEYAALLKMNDASQAFVNQHSTLPTNEELVNRISQSSNMTDAKKTVEELRPYLNEGGMTTIFWKPLDLNSIYVNAIIVLLLSLFFVSNYFHNRPHSAYLDKIFVLFFLLCLVEIVHIFAYVSSSTLVTYHAIFMIGQYVTISCLLLMVYAFNLRLRFVLSATGKYYEEVLQSSPQKVTRWRDEVDNIILKSFFNAGQYNKRLGHYNDKEDNS